MGDTEGNQSPLDSLFLTFTLSYTHITGLYQLIYIYLLMLPFQFAPQYLSGQNTLPSSSGKNNNPLKIDKFGGRVGVIIVNDT